MNPLTSARRSFVYRRLSESTQLGDPKGVDSAQRPAGSEPKLKLVDLSVLPRWGIKGRETLAWLKTQGAITPSGDNRSVPQDDGSLIARLSPGETLILSSVPSGRSSLAQAIETIPPVQRSPWESFL